ncbi:MAG: arabinose ABC transporter substrate-binding protein [Verrucomicrobiota bacterium]
MPSPLRSVFRLALVLLAAAGCTKPPPGAAAPDRIKLGYLVKQPEEPWFQYEWKGAEAAAARHGIALLKISVPDGEKTLAAIDSLAANGAQGFVICTPDVRLGPAILAKARAAGLKVFAVDDRFLGADGAFLTEVPYLGMSATAIGEMSGRALAAEMRHRGWAAADTAVCLITFDELATCRERTDGIRAALLAAGFPADRIYPTPQRTTDIPGGFDATHALLAQKSGVRHWLIAGMNDSATLGGVRATEGQTYAAADVIGFGIGGTDCLDEFRKPAPTGFHGAIFVSAVQEGFRATELLYFWVRDGTPPPADTRTTGQPITRENFEQVLRAEGML